MSYILDALRKSEAERQRESLPSVAKLARAPLAPARRTTPLWSWIVIGSLSLALLAVGAASWKRGAVGPERAGTAAAATPPNAAERTRESSVAAGGPNLPAASATTRTPPLADAGLTPEPITRLAQIDPALANLALEFFSFDADDASAGSVWINGTRYAPGERIEGGPEIVAVRPDGVLLSQAGRSYLLKPR